MVKNSFSYYGDPSSELSEYENLKSIDNNTISDTIGRVVVPNFATTRVGMGSGMYVRRYEFHRMINKDSWKTAEEQR